MPLYRKKIITRGNNEAYLIRYSIPWLTCKWFAVKIHHILLSDDACLHSHPWGFVSIILRGGYLEHRYKKEPIYNVRGKWGARKIAKYYRSGNILWRPKNTIHRLNLLENNGMVQTAWTFVITFRKVQGWGFFTPSGYVDHRDYQQDGGCEA